jgi:hypothetical protein
LAALKSGVSRGSVYWGGEHGRGSAGGTPAVPDGGQYDWGLAWIAGVSTVGLAGEMNAIPCRGISGIRTRMPGIRRGMSEIRGGMKQIGSPMTKQGKRKGIP